jgi:hypothetical protein
MTAAFPCVAILLIVGIVIRLELGERAQTVVDPSGGTCDAVGDFDRLIPFPDDVPMLSRLDPYGDVTFASAEMRAICDEVQMVIPRASDGPEHRGLLRLHALATRGAELPDSILHAAGD